MTGNERFTLSHDMQKKDLIFYDNGEELGYLEVLDLLNRLNDENESMKSELSIYRRVASCDNCNHHYYDWDVDEGYGAEEVCCKGNDVSDGICRDWTWECARWSNGSKVVDGIFKGAGKND